MRMSDGAIFLPAKSLERNAQSKHAERRAQSEERRVWGKERKDQSAWKERILGSVLLSALSSKLYAERSML